MSTGAVREELLRFVEVLLEDDDLRAWFESLEGVPAARRGAEFSRMASRMQAAGEHIELIQATALLAENEVYQAVWLTVRAARAEA